MDIWRRRLFVISLGTVGACVLLTVGALVYTSGYADRVLPGVTLGGVVIGGMDSAELREYLQTLNDRLMSDGVTVRFSADGKQQQFQFSPSLVGSDVARELYHIDIPAEVERLVARGKQGNIFKRMWRTFRSLSASDTAELQTLSVNRRELLEILKDRLSRFERPAADARISIRQVEPLDVFIEPERTGQRYDFDGAARDIVAAWQALQAPDIIMRDTVEAPAVLAKDLRELIPRLPAVLSAGGIELAFVDTESGEKHEWKIRAADVKSWLRERRRDGNVVFDLDGGELQNYLALRVTPEMRVTPRDAKFAVDEQNRVVEFQGSRVGRSLNLSATLAAVSDLMAARTFGTAGATSTVAIVVDSVPPAVATGDVNSFGVSEVLGVGISRYAGSPANRVKNIANAVKKLNGILVAPGEEFSAIKYLQPFTIEAGYLPELVIKGDELKPEVGGGLCQLGTTLFRMAMNSAMPITQRQNHSLVVQYYGDVRNGLPGTDATIYEPAPDFRFKNDTGHYVLVETDMDRAMAELRFTLWGKSDGRKGSYTAPKVSGWIGAGETKNIETDTLPPGEKKCQHAFRGANASFTYLRELPDGTAEERIFTSHYRPLPEICLVGKAAEGEVISDPPAAVDIPTAIE